MLYQVLGSGAGQQLVVEWYNVRHYSQPTRFTFEAVLGLSDGSIRFNYQSLDTGDSSTAGALRRQWASRTRAAVRMELAFNNGPNAYVGSTLSTVITHGPAYAVTPVASDFTEISGTGTALSFSNADDASTAVSPPGFSFPFYSQTYTTLYVATNGLITFGSADTAYNNQDLTSGSPPEPAIAPLWDDLYVDSSGAVYYQVVGQQLVVEWSNVQHYGFSGRITFEAVLDGGDGSIRFNYQSLDTGDGSTANAASATVGIKDAGSQSWGGNVLELAFNNGPNAYVGSGSRTLITPAGNLLHEVDLANFRVVRRRLGHDRLRGISHQLQRPGPGSDPHRCRGALEHHMGLRRRLDRRGAVGQPHLWQERRLLGDVERDLRRPGLPRHRPGDRQQCTAAASPARYGLDRRFQPDWRGLQPSSGSTAPPMTSTT